MARVSVAVDIAAPAGRVWSALTVPAQVPVWDGVTPDDVPDGYPVPDHHARWRTRVGPVTCTLHDRVRVVEPPTVLASGIDVALVQVDERYTLTPTSRGTRVVSDNDVGSRIPGLGRRLARRLARSNVEASMTRLKAFCERSAGERPLVPGSPLEYG